MTSNHCSGDVLLIFVMQVPAACGKGMVGPEFQHPFGYRSYYQICQAYLSLG